jgi:hypothetical protein
VLGATQIQKTRASALAYGILASLGVTISVVAPKAEQAITPLQYLIGVLDYNPYFRNLMLQGGDDKFERMQSSESKKFVSFKGGGFVRALSLNEKDGEDKKKAALGKGSQIVAQEEASLLSNTTDAMATRMVGGWGNRGRVIKLGNAITREDDYDHYYRSTLGDDGYVTFKMDYHRALQEGIFTADFIAEMKKKPLFESLYACVFPDPKGMLKGGYRRLFTIDQIIDAKGTGSRSGKPILGLDIGTGKPDKTSLIARWGMYAEKVYESSSDDIMAQIGEYRAIIEELNPSVVNVDATGMGNSVAPRLQELGINAQPIIVGGSSPEKGYANIKAYNYAKVLYEWVVAGGKLGNGDWDQLKEVAFKITSDKNTKIESKDELIARGIPSYNDADALMLTFSNESTFNVDTDFI